MMLHVIVEIVVRVKAFANQGQGSKTRSFLPYIRPTCPGFSNAKRTTGSAEFDASTSLIYTLL